jgi:hypothetical protein
MFARSDIYFRLHLLLIIIHITWISLSLHRTSAHIHMTSVLGVLGTQETSCIIIIGLFERDTFELFLSEFDKPWVIHLRETCCCSTNICTWRPNTVCKNRSVHRHQRHIKTLLVELCRSQSSLVSRRISLAEEDAEGGRRCREWAERASGVWPKQQTGRGHTVALVRSM